MDLEQIVGLLRTIFVGEEEVYISVTVTFDNDIEHVEYNKGKLINYESRIALDHHCKNSDIMEFGYQTGKGANFSITDKFNNINDNEQNDNNNEEEKNGSADFPGWQGG